MEPLAIMTPFTHAVPFINRDDSETTHATTPKLNLIVSDTPD
jgi:hypothetical protein